MNYRIPTPFLLPQAMYKFYVSWNVNTILFKGVKTRVWTTHETEFVRNDFVEKISCSFFFFFERITINTTFQRNVPNFSSTIISRIISSSLIQLRDVVTRFKHRFEPQFDQLARITFFIYFPVWTSVYVYTIIHPSLLIYRNIIYNIDISETVYGTFKKKERKKERWSKLKF